eukprot:GGOE01014932.1.p1 GENE.GGOE01014932.1~~GGOE01014932.1.p1  ORF type:complete len:1527 (+),score=352.37 GGOE01014932.1:137-4717(+)
MAMTANPRQCTKKLRPVFSPQTDPLKGHNLPKHTIRLRPTSADSNGGKVRFEHLHKSSDEEWEIRYEHDLSSWMSIEDKDGKVVEGLRSLFDVHDDGLPSGLSINDLSSAQLAKINQSLAQPKIGGAYLSALQQEENLAPLGVPFASSNLPTFVHEMGEDAVKKLVASRLQWWQTEMEGETRSSTKELAGLQRYLKELPQGGNQWRMVAHTLPDSDDELPEDDDDLLGPGIEKFFITAPQVHLPKVDNTHLSPPPAELPAPPSPTNALPNAMTEAATILQRRLDVMGRLLDLKDEQKLDAERYVQALKRRIWKLRLRLSHNDTVGRPGEGRREEELLQLRAEREWLYAKMYSLQNQNMQTVEDYVEKVKEHAMLRVRSAQEEGERLLKAQKADTQQAREDGNKTRSQLRAAKEQAARWNRVAQGLGAKLASFEETAMYQADQVAVHSNWAVQHSPEPAYTFAPEDFFTELRTRAAMERDLDVVRFMPFVAASDVTLQSPFRHSFGEVRGEMMAMWLGFVEKLDQLLGIVGAGTPIDFTSQVAALKALLQEALAAVAKHLQGLQQNCQKVIEKEVEAKLDARVKEALGVCRVDTEAQTDEELAPNSDPSQVGGAARSESSDSHKSGLRGAPALDSVPSFVSDSSEAAAEYELLEEDPLVHHEKRKLERQVDEFSAALEEVLQMGIAADDEFCLASGLLQDFKQVMGAPVPPTLSAATLSGKAKGSATVAGSRRSVTSVASTARSGSVKTAPSSKRLSSGVSTSRSNPSTFTKQKPPAVSPAVPVSPAMPAVSPATPTSPASAMGGSMRSTRSRLSAMMTRSQLGSGPSEIVGQISSSLSRTLHTISGGVLGSNTAPEPGEKDSQPVQLGQLHDTVLQLSTCLKLKAAAERSGRPNQLLPDGPMTPSALSTTFTEPGGNGFPAALFHMDTFDAYITEIDRNADLAPGARAPPVTTCSVGTMTTDLLVADPGLSPTTHSPRTTSPQSPRNRATSPASSTVAGNWSLPASRPTTGRHAATAGLTPAQMRLIQSLHSLGERGGMPHSSPLSCHGTMIGSNHARNEAAQIEVDSSRQGTRGSPPHLDELDMSVGSPPLVVNDSEWTDQSRALFDAVHGRDPIAARASRPARCTSRIRAGSASRPKSVPTLKLKQTAPLDDPEAGEAWEAGKAPGPSHPQSWHGWPTYAASRSRSPEDNAGARTGATPPAAHPTDFTPTAAGGRLGPSPLPAESQHSPQGRSSSPLRAQALFGGRPATAGSLSTAALRISAAVPLLSPGSTAGKVSQKWLELHRVLFRLLMLLRHAFSIPIVVDEPLSPLYSAAHFDTKAGLFGEPEEPNPTTPDVHTSLGVLQLLLSHDTQLAQAFHSYIEDVLGLTRGKLLGSVLEGLDGHVPGKTLGLADHEGRPMSAALAQEKTRGVYLFRPGTASSPSPFPTPEMIGHNPIDSLAFKRAMAEIQRYEERRTVLPLLKHRIPAVVGTADQPEEKPKPSFTTSPPRRPSAGATHGEEPRDRPPTTVEMASAIQRSFGNFL